MRASLPVLIAPMVGCLVAMATPALASGSGPRVMEPLPITAADLQSGLANHSPELVADPGNPLLVVAATRIDGPDFSCALQVSPDSGRLWAPTRPVPSLPSGAQKCYALKSPLARMVASTISSQACRERRMRRWGVFLTTSGDQGGSFSQPRRLPADPQPRSSRIATSGRAW